MQYMIIPLDVLQENLIEVKEIRSSISVWFIKHN